ncbi:hypothetical protein MO867_23380, partial [Microbulbifer sp. OS29]
LPAQLGQRRGKVYDVLARAAADLQQGACRWQQRRQLFQNHRLIAGAGFAVVKPVHGGSWVG